MQGSQRRVPLRHRAPERRGDLFAKDGDSSKNTLSNEVQQSVEDRNLTHEILRPQGAHNDRLFMSDGVSSDEIASSSHSSEGQDSFSIKAGTSFEDAISHAKAHGHTEDSYRKMLIKEISKRIKNHKDPP